MLMPSLPRRFSLVASPCQRRWCSRRCTRARHEIDTERHRDNADEIGKSDALADQEPTERGCLYRNRAINALETVGRAWHIAYTSPNVFGIQAAVSAGLGVSILPEVAILPDHNVLGAGDGFPPITDTEVALVAAPEASAAHAVLRRFSPISAAPSIRG
jgi:DNA-binding transcriptional LysR family regulator